MNYMSTYKNSLMSNCISKIFCYYKTFAQYPMIISFQVIKYENKFVITNNFKFDINQ